MASTGTGYDGLLLGGSGPAGSGATDTDPGRSWLALCMVASVDGAVSFGGRSAGLGGPADRRALGLIRDAADTILVGAGTVRDERYGHPPTSPERQERRAAKGLPLRPRVVVVTRTGVLPADLPLLADPDLTPTLLCAAVDEERVRSALAAHPAPAARASSVLVAGAERIDWAGALTMLASQGSRRVTCEGGPSLNAALVAADLVDELFITVGPALVGGDAPRLLVGAEESRRPLTLAGVHAEGDEVLLRYLTVRGARRADARPTDA